MDPIQTCRAKVKLRPGRRRQFTPEEYRLRENARASRYRKANAEKWKVIRRQSFLRNYAANSAKAAALTRRATDELHDCYVRTMLSRDTSVPRKAWPDWLVKLKRLAVKLKRKHGIHQASRRRTQ